MTSVQPEHRIELVRESLYSIVTNLRALGYRFEDPSRVLPGPEPGTGGDIQKIEREIGALPAALKSFWTIIGSVGLSGSHPDWDGCEYPDPLIIYPPSVAIQELDEFLADREERERCNFPYRVPIAPDALHKANVSGGMWLNIDVPAKADDPPLNEAPGEMTFLEYLDLAVRWGGFLGLRDCSGHSWPLARITSAPA